MRGLTQDEYETAATLRYGLRRFLAGTEKITRAHGLTPERYQLLLLIKVSPEGESTVGQLAKQLWIGQSAATQLVRRAENLGLLERTLSPRDARLRLLRLSSEGEKRLAGALTELRQERSVLATALAEIMPALIAATDDGKAEQLPSQRPTTKRPRRPLRKKSV